MKLKNRVFCFFFGHRYRIVQKFGGTERRIKCRRCGGDWAMSDRVKAILPWDGELEQLYKDFGYEIKEPFWT